jgi:hypothetical protein
LSLHAGADPERVAGEAARVLSEEVEDRIPERLSGARATEVVQTEEWRDQGQVAELSAIERRTLIVRALLVLVLVGIAVGCGVFWWRRRKRRSAKSGHDE